MRYGDTYITEIAGYILGDRIGSGGMGDVYKAYNASLNRTAAVKVLHQAEMADRFKNEAYIQSSVTHPNIARLYEFTACGNQHCIVMEYVEGECLDALLKRKGKLSSPETEDIIRQILSALAYLHKKDIFHRDIKPQNFKIQADGTVKMLDFGIARHKYSPRLTRQGFIVGTTEYLAPEQFHQEPELKSDIWALGVMTYELVTGYLPFEGTNPVVIQSLIKKAQYTDPRILVPDISGKLVELIEKSLRVNPATRPSASSLASLLGKNSRLPALAGKSIPPVSKKLLALGSGGVLFILLCWQIFFKSNTETPVAPVPETVQQTIAPAIAENSITINTPGIENAELVLTDGVHQLPYTLSGKEGDKFDFTLRANGYKDKPVQVILTPRRLSYEFNLEKN